MDGLRLKYKFENDSWVLEPIQVSDHRHSSADTFFGSSEASARPSFSSSGTPLRWSPYNVSGDAAASKDRGRFWRSLKKYWTCLSPPTETTEQTHHHHHHHENNERRATKKEKEKIERCGGSVTEMKSEERDEHIRELVLYCKSTLTS